eukprot:TRINITY_DN9230_c0_g1_i1.p1 TRINITY_DN9230_c0_g1~~TRINITY_DN9230_c0_g1_i1.p1  ORF type:complete len:342 (-),score=33.23 TRINITY_DN9230_c0_g1_i1:178-1203(-)
MDHDGEALSTELIKVHVSPTLEVMQYLDDHSLLLQKPPNFVFLEQFYDTPFLGLAQSKCWLKRKYDFNSKKGEWCFQENSKKFDTSLIYKKLCVGDHDTVLNYIQKREDLKMVNKKFKKLDRMDKLQRIASFVTSRYQLSTSIYLDESVFDFYGQERYTVITYHLEKNINNYHSTSLSKMARPALSTVLEYLRRYNPTAFSLFKNDIAYNLPLTVDPKINDSLKKYRPSSDQLQQISPEGYKAQCEYNKYEASCEKVKNEYLPQLLENRSMHGKWAVFVENNLVVEKPSIYANYTDAARESTEQPLEKGSRVYLMHITPEYMLNGLASDFLLYNGNVVVGS